MKRNPQKKLPLNIFVLIAGVLVVSAALGAIFLMRPNKDVAIGFAVDTTLANGDVELCSSYANLCFTRPADWTRSTILHAGSSTENNIEINPPTGRILRFEAIGNDTERSCPRDAECKVTPDSIVHLENGLYVVSGLFETSFLTYAARGQVAFVQLIDADDVASLGLQVGKSTPYVTFNPGVALGNGSKVMVQVALPKGLSSEASKEWLASDEAMTTKEILSSVRPR